MGSILYNLVTSSIKLNIFYFFVVCLFFLFIFLDLIWRISPQKIVDFLLVSVRLLEADDQSGRCHPEPVPLLLRTQTIQKEHGIAFDVIRFGR